uniref:Uncharacterized protein n=1 Tax=Meloidogyne hapla TaxID=6305 RepID=A0A1I8BL84_MELHA
MSVPPPPSYDEAKITAVPEQSHPPNPPVVHTHVINMPSQHDNIPEQHVVLSTHQIILMNINNQHTSPQTRRVSNILT